MQVVTEAMIMTKAGRRTASVTALRISDTAMLELTNTRMVAMPRPRALTAVLLTPSNGHRPSSCTSPGLLCHRPSAVSSNSFLSAMGRLLWRQLQQGVAVLAEINERLVYRLHHGARGDGGAGELVEVATVLAHRPTLGRGHGQALAIEAENPVSLGQFQLVAQAGGFPMVGHAYAGQLAIGANAHQQVNTATVAVHGHHRQDYCRHLAALSSTPGGGGAGQAQMGAIIDTESIVQQFVVMLVVRQYLIECAHLHALLFGDDPLLGTLLDHGNQADGEDGEQAENQAVAQYRAAGRRHRIHVITLPCPGRAWPCGGRRCAGWCSSR